IPPASLEPSSAGSYGSDSYASPYGGRVGQHAASPVPAARPPADLGDRPLLPRRQNQAHIAPQLRDTASARRGRAPAAEMPGLMAAFQSGVSRAEQEAEQDEGSSGTGWPGRSDSAR